MTSNETPPYEPATRHGPVHAPSGGPSWRALKVVLWDRRRAGIARSDGATTEDPTVIHGRGFDDGRVGRSEAAPDGDLDRTTRPSGDGAPTHEGSEPPFRRGAAWTAFHPFCLLFGGMDAWLHVWPEDEGGTLVRCARAVRRGAGWVALGGIVLIYVGLPSGPADGGPSPAIVPLLHVGGMVFVAAILVRLLALVPIALCNRQAGRDRPRSKFGSPRLWIQR